MKPAPGEDTPEYYAFHQANKTVAPGACELLELALASWQKGANYHAWEMPDGFTVFIPVMVQVETKIEVDELDHATFTYVHEVNQGTETGLSLAANTIHSVDGMVVREMSRRCNYNWAQLLLCSCSLKTSSVCGMCLSSRSARSASRNRTMTSGFISLVGVDYINANSVAILRYRLPELLTAPGQENLTRKSFPIIAPMTSGKHTQTTSTSFVRPTSTFTAEIAESDMLSHYMTQIRGEYFEVQKYSTDLADLIREGNYAIS